ncbi:MAG: deoxycytidylate deaminase [Peptococcaceae bacterium]
MMTAVRERPDWDHYFMEITSVVAKRSTCLRRQIGAILVKEKHILATGYNGAPKGLAHCVETGCLRQQLGIPSGERHELCRALHAEQNAIIQAANLGVSIQGSTLYSTTAPCSLCAKMLINAGVVRVVFSGEYPDKRAMDFFREAGVVVEQLKLENNEV